jgi:hypothetical protein
VCLFVAGHAPTIFVLLRSPSVLLLRIAPSAKGSCQDFI